MILNRSVTLVFTVLALVLCGWLSALQPGFAQEGDPGGEGAGTAAGNTAESPGKQTADKLEAEPGQEKETDTEETTSEEPAGAGNVADATGTTEAAGETGEGTGEAEAEPVTTEGGDSESETKDAGPGLTGSDLAELGFELPEFTDGQPGFIPDLEPTDLLEERDDIAGFKTFLGPTQLPGDDSRDLINRYQGQPDRGLDDNFARVVVSPGGTIEGSTETKQFHIEGGVLIYYSQIQISGDSADIDEKNEVAILRGDVEINDPQYTMEADELLIYFEDKRFQAKGFVQFEKRADPEKGEPDLALPKKDRLREYFAGQKFELFCKELFYDWDSKSMTANESVRLNHPVFNGSMDRLDYNDTTKEYELTGGVSLEVTEYGWIFDNELVEGDDVQKVEALTDGSTQINCERVVYSEEGGVAQFYARPGGEVQFVQPGRTVTAAYIEVNDGTKDFHAEAAAGQKVIYNQTDGEWLFTGGLVDREGADQDMQDALGGPLETNSATLTYNFDRKRLELLGGVVILAGTRTVQAGEVIQDETAKFFLMRQNVHIKPDPESEIVAAQVYYDTENDIVTMIGMVQGKLTSDDLPVPGEEQAAGEAGDEDFEAAAGVFRQQSSVRNENNNSNVAEGG